MKFYRLTFFALAFFIFAACQSAVVNDQPLSPTATMQALNDAAKKRDAEAIKKLLSQATLDLFADLAKQQNTTVDALLRRDEGTPFQELPETRNEKIAGETATIEIKNNATNDWESMPFVRENGVWKIALDRFLDDAMKRMNEEMKEIPVNPPAANSGNAPKPAANSAVNK